jgi:nicotinamidase-related amidase
MLAMLMGPGPQRLHHVAGGETDVCVLSTMLGAIDWGFRVILIQDALAVLLTKRTMR